MICAVTGASGYVGSILAAALNRKFQVIPIVRKPASPNSIQWSLTNARVIDDQLRERNVTTLVHSAWDFSHPSEKENQRCNVEGSHALFESARRAGVQRIVFISTISAFDTAHSNYGQSKLQVERMVLDQYQGIVIRPGLVWGLDPGGMFGSLNKQIDGGRFIPLIGSGNYPQYLVHQDDLGDAILKAASGDLHSDTAITVANSQPWMLRDLIKSIAMQKRRSVTLLPVPWPAVYLALKTAELAGIKLTFRSDSVLSLVYQNPAPDFTTAKRLGLQCRPYVSK